MQNKELSLVFTLLITYGVIAGIWALVFLSLVNLVFGPFEQEGMVTQLTIIIGIMSYVLLAPRIAKKLSNKWEMHKLKK